MGAMHEKLTTIVKNLNVGAIGTGEFSSQIAAEHYQPHLIPVRGGSVEIKSILLRSDVDTDFYVFFYSHNELLFDRTQVMEGPAGIATLNTPIGIRSPEYAGVPGGGSRYYYFFTEFVNGLHVPAFKVGQEWHIGVLVGNDDAGVQAANVCLNIQGRVGLLG